MLLLNLDVLLWTTCRPFFFFFCIVYLGQANWSVRTRYAGGVLRSSKGKRQYQSSLFLSLSLSSPSHSVLLTPPSVTLPENTHHFPHQLLSIQLQAPVKTITHSYQRLSRPHQTAGPHSPSPLSPGEPRSHDTTRDGRERFRPWLFTFAPNLNLDLSRTRSLSISSVVIDNKKGHSVLHTAGMLINREFRRWVEKKREITPEPQTIT